MNTNDRPITKTETSMVRFMETLDPQSVRFRALNCAVRFKSNWLDLGELLNSLLKNSGFREWGYDTFDDYCKQELKIKPDTAMKLVGSFGYIRKFKPELAKTESTIPAPDYRLITKLMEAEKMPGLSEDDFRTLRKSVFSDGVSPSALKNQISRLSGAEESGTDSHARHVERLQFLLTAIKKTVSRFNPSDDVTGAIEILENFTADLKD